MLNSAGCSNDFSRVFVDVPMVTFQLSMVIKLDADLAGLYEDATELEQVFIKKLALFFTGEGLKGFAIHI